MAEVQPMEVDQRAPKATQKVSNEVDSITFEDVREHCRRIERAESIKEFREINSVLRSLITTRRRLTNNVLWRLVNYYYVGPASARQKSELIAYLKAPDTSDQKPETEDSSTDVASQASKSETLQRKENEAKDKRALQMKQASDIEAYLHLLLVLFLMGENRFSEAEHCINNLMKRLENQNRRSVDSLVAKVYYFYMVISEKLNKLSDCVPFFHSRLSVAKEWHHDDSQATLINCLLRTHVNDKDYDTAKALITSTKFPLSANTNEWARYHYYIGRIKVTESEYAEAKQALQLALSKAPQHIAVGFRQSVQKFLVTVELLTGVIPERSLFRQAIYRKPLLPYFQLTQAVRIGNISRFDETVQKFADQLARDETYTLVVRLRSNVIMTAVRGIARAYSAIFLADVQKKLQLSNLDDAEYIVAKAIKDGVIDAEIHHTEGYVELKQSGDLYSTPIPQIEFDARIKCCLDIHDQAVKAMRFPPKSGAKDLETSEEKREREQQELEFAKEMADEDEDYS